MGMYWLASYMNRVQFYSGVAIVSKNGMEPSGLVSSTVNLTAWSMVLIC